MPAPDPLASPDGVPDDPALFEGPDEATITEVIAAVARDASDAAVDIEYMVHAYVADPQNDRQSWRIADDSVADWAMAKVVHAEAEITRHRARRDAFINRADRWFEAVTADARRTRDFMTAHLELYGLAVREASPLGKDGQPTVKTVRLPMGDIKTRRNKPTPRPMDMDELVEWAKEYAPDLVETVEKVPASRLRAKLVLTGVPICTSGRCWPGVMVAFRQADGDLWVCGDCGTAGDPENTAPRWMYDEVDETGEPTGRWMPVPAVDATEETVTASISPRPLPTDGGPDSWAV